MKFLKLAAIITAFIFYLPVYADGPSQLVFTSTDTWVDVGEVIKLTVQVQDSSGNSVKLPETISILLKSSSASGEFSSSNSNWETVPILTMNKNTANRTFYYRDSSSGDVTVTVSGLASMAPATFNISIGGSAPLTQNTNSGNENSNTVTPTQSSSISSSSSSSKVSSLWNISAGPNRRVLAGFPIEFEVESSGPSDSHFQWSFGDGTIARGRLADHIYYSPGTYHVVAIGKNGDRELMSRTTVEVLSPEIKITTTQTMIGSAIVISNNLNKEINIGRGLIEGGDRVITLPDDLYIGPNSSVTLSPKIYQPKIDQSLSLATNEKIALDTYNPNQEAMIAELEFLKSELAKMMTQKTSAPVAKTPDNNEITKSTESNLDKSNQIVLNPQKSWWQRLFGW